MSELDTSEIFANGFEAGYKTAFDKQAARIAALEAALKAHEAWEADVIMTGDWSGETVRLTQAQIDALPEVQRKRNAVLYPEGLCAALKGGSKP